MVFLWLLLILQILKFSTADDGLGSVDLGEGVKDLQKNEENFLKAPSDSQKSAAKVIINHNASLVRVKKEAQQPEMSVEAKGRRIFKRSNLPRLRRSLFYETDTKPVNDIDDIDDDDEDSDDELVYTVFDYDDGSQEESSIVLD